MHNGIEKLKVIIMNTTSKIVAVTLIAIIVAAIGAYAYIQSTQPTTQPSPSPTPTPTPAPTPTPTRLIVSSTTSLYETGFLNTLQTAFQAKYPWITLSFLSQGTGIAIQ
ncbi:MAG: hypothetical protein V1754_01675, partial [Pseudomonadota bacterium]